MTTLRELVQQPEKIDELLDELDTEAQNFSLHEYGLPLHDENLRRSFRNIITVWVAKTGLGED